MESVYIISYITGAAITAYEIAFSHEITPAMAPLIYWHKAYYLCAWMLPRGGLALATVASCSMALLNLVYWRPAYIAVDLAMMIVCVYRMNHGSSPFCVVQPWRLAPATNEFHERAYTAMIILLFAMVITIRTYEPLVAEIVPVIAWTVVFSVNREFMDTLDRASRFAVAIFWSLAFMSLFSVVNAVKYAEILTKITQVLFVLLGVICERPVGVGVVAPV